MSTVESQQKTIRVAVCGAMGKMGQEVVKTVLEDPALSLVGAVDVNARGEAVASFCPSGQACDLRFVQDLSDMLKNEQPAVCVDFTNPDVVYLNAMQMIEAGCRPIIGTTGLSPEQLGKIDAALNAKGIGGMVVPNFAIGAVLMMKFAQEASKYFEHAEIIEQHHNRKADAPSGTAIKTAELMREARLAFGQDNAPEKETYAGARGGVGPADIHIHSVRLPGLVAHQEVIFGSAGQTLTIRHDSLHRTSFMPGVALAVKKVMTFKGLIYGLEHIL